MTGPARAEITDNSRRNSAACENLSLLAPYFGLSKRHHSATYMLVHGTAAGWPAP